MKRREEVRSSDFQEAEAIRQAQRGDANAFELLYRLHSSRVFALCLRMLKNTAEAEDLTQETFLTVSGGMRMVHCGGPVQGGPPELSGGGGRRR